jgi:hypothetical protein
VHAIVIDVQLDINREAEARKMLLEMIVPRAKSHAGFTAGYWLRSLQDDVIRSLHVYDSLDAARSAADAIGSQGPPPGAPVNLVSITSYEVLASA